MEEVKWIKIHVNMFSNRKIKLIRSMKNGDSFVLLWTMLLTAAGRCNADGKLYIADGVPYTEDMFATEFDMKVSIVRDALQEFEKFKMISRIDGVYCVLGWSEYQNIEGMDKIREQTRKRVEKYRDKKEIAIKDNVTCNAKVTPCNVTSNVTVTQCNATDIEIDKEERNKNILSTTIKAYEKHIGAITEVTAEAISEWLEKGADSSLIIFAFEQAVEYNARSWKYAEKIISTHFNAGRKTRTAAENFGKKKTDKKKSGSYEPDDMAAMERKMRLERMKNNAE
ncbi:MAG: DnaD domain protein [Ruminococcaceae bacterium]|nr:DnaD domain protein [Oscillospiraceae bacterium]